MKEKYDRIPFTDVEEKVVHKIVDSRDKAAIKFPLAFGLAASFGLVATFYGFEGLINKVDWLQQNPWAILGIGVAVLVATGTAYRKLN
jgi:hypothetical protein